MSTIQHFSMSALADLMIVEEPDETESYLEDDEEYGHDEDFSQQEQHEEDEAALNTMEKSLASTQYSADYTYDTEEFEQESFSLPVSSPHPPEKPLKSSHIEDDSARMEEKKRSDSFFSESSGSALDYSDSQNEASSRTIFEMPNSRLNNLSPIGQSKGQHAEMRTLNYNDLQDITGVNIDEIKQRDIGDDSFDNGHSHSMVQSSPHIEKVVDNKAEPVQSNKLYNSTLPPELSSKPHNLADDNKIIKAKQRKVAYGGQYKGYSTVRKLNSADVSKLRQTSSQTKNDENSTYHDINSSRNRSYQPKVVNNGEHNLNADDIKLMREVRKVLNKIEQSDMVSDEVQKHMPRRSIVVPAVKLGSGKAWQTQYCGKNYLKKEIDIDSHEIQNPAHIAVSAALLNSSDDSSLFKDISVYDEDDTRIVNDSKTLSKNEVEVIANTSEDQSLQQTTRLGDPNPLHQSAVNFPIDHRATNTQVEMKIAGKHNSHPLPSEKLFALSDLAEQTYASFLSDIIDIAKNRAAPSNVSSIEELAMLRSLSEYIFETFAKPKAVESVRKNMIDAAIAVHGSKK